MHDAVHRLYQEFFTLKAEFHEIQNYSTAFVQTQYKKTFKIGKKNSKAQVEIYLRPSLNNNFHIADPNETHICLTTLFETAIPNSTKSRRTVQPLILGHRRTNVASV
jgi:hypothetical protein